MIAMAPSQVSYFHSSSPLHLLIKGPSAVSVMLIKQKPVPSIHSPNPQLVPSQRQSQTPVNELQVPIQPGAPPFAPRSLSYSSLPFCSAQPFCFPCCCLNWLGSLLPQDLCTCCFFCLDSFPQNTMLWVILSPSTGLCSNITFTSRISPTTLSQNCKPYSLLLSPLHPFSPSDIGCPCPHLSLEWKLHEGKGFSLFC